MRGFSGAGKRGHSGRLAAAASPGLMREVRVPLVVGPSEIHGRGVLAATRIPARTKIGEFAGERISWREARRRARGRRHIAIVELEDGTAIDASVRGNIFRYLNHSCAPNAFLRILGAHAEFYALRPIERGEEITCDTGETHHGGTLPCRCGAHRCRSFI